MNKMPPDACPRPQLTRPEWWTLDGPWAFSAELDSGEKIAGTIRVPYAPETPASGIGRTEFYTSCTYERTFEPRELKSRERCVLHFEAVDDTAEVWLNDQFIGRHVGGYTRFSFDVTHALIQNGPQRLRVVCRDDPHDMHKPRGKQDWLEQAHAIWYPRTTGIWQTVWLEIVPTVHLCSLHWTASIADWSFTLTARLNAPLPGAKLRVELSTGGRSLTDDTFSFTRDQVSRTIRLPDAGIDSARDELYWFPHRPNLIDARLTLLGESGEVLDQVGSYTAMRTVSADGDRFMLNGRAIELRMLLDQGYWAETGLTPPDDEALRRDIKLVQAMGFNGVRKHQKIESERFLHLADKLGLLVWEEMPNPYGYSAEMVRRTTTEWMAVVERDASHPCVIAWVPLNESWGVPDLPLRQDQRQFTEGLYLLTKSLDPTRPVVSNDGWEIPRTDLINIHDYDHDPARLADRYDHTKRPVAEILRVERPGNRLLALDSSVYTGQPILLTEFGGIALSADENATWGYSRAADGQDLLERYAKLLAAVRQIRIFSGFCYTQFTDTYQEANGLVTMDRQPKADPRLIAIATRGPANPREAEELKALLES